MKHIANKSWLPFALGLGSFFLVVLAFLAVGHFAQAVTIENVGGTLGFGAADLKETIVNILKWALGLLGLVAVMVMIYGGFLWLTSHGNQQQLDKAKRTLINGVIGLVIVLLAWAIVLFVLRFISKATTGAGAAECGPAVGIPFGPTSPPSCVDCEDTGTVGDDLGTYVNNGTCFPHGTAKQWTAINEVPAIGETSVSLCSQAAEIFGGLGVEIIGGLPVDLNNPSAGVYTVNEVVGGANFAGSTQLLLNRTAMFLHVQDFKPSTEYEVTRAGFMSSGTTPVPLTPPGGPEWRFTTGTEGDNTPPRVSVVSPTGTINCLKPELQAVFSEPMLPLSVNLENITITATPPASPPTAKLTSIIMNSLMTGFMANFDKPLDPNVTYIVTLNADLDTSVHTIPGKPSYIKGFKDMCLKNALDGNANGTAQGTPADDYSWTFTTANTTVVDCTPKINSIESVGYYGNNISVPAQAFEINGENFGVTGTGVHFPGQSAIATEADGTASSCFNPAYRPKQSSSVACIRPGTDWTPTKITTLVPAGMTPSAYPLDPATNGGGALDGPVVVETGVNSPPSDPVDIQSPHIDWVSPDNGKEGTFITISGSHFGSTAGTINFRRTDGTEVTGTIPACAGTSGWTEDPTTHRSQIVVQVPPGFAVNELADIQVVHNSLPNAEGRSNLQRFTVNDKEHPGLCSIVPQCHNTGGGMLTATGQGFGSDIAQLHSLYIPSDVTKPTTNGVLANLDSVSGTVESTAGAIFNDNYIFQMQVGSDMTNPLAYKISCLPAPAVVQDASCNLGTGVMPSPNPYPGSTNVCRNSSFQVRFNQAMVNADVIDFTNVLLERCGTGPTFTCTSPATINLLSILFAPPWTVPTYTPNATFTLDTWYRVTLRGANLHSQATGVAIGADYVWTFHVRPDNADCAFDAVAVTPPQAGPLFTTQTQPFLATPSNAQCALLTGIPGNFTWDVTANPLLVGLGAPTTVPPSPPPTHNQVVATVQGGTTDGTATITATLSGKSGSGDLVVKRNYCDTDLDCQTFYNNGGKSPFLGGYLCSASTCNVPTHECRPWIQGLQSGTDFTPPIEGPPGNLIIVRGCFFGYSKGTGEVTFTDSTGLLENGINICKASWTNDEILIQAAPKNAAPGAYAVRVIAGNTLQSTNTGTYNVVNRCDTNDPLVKTDIPGGGVPILCGITPPAGRPGNSIAYNGAQFDTTVGNSEAFYTEANGASQTFPLAFAGTGTIINSVDKITSRVPVGAGIPTSDPTAQTTIGVKPDPVFKPTEYCLATPRPFAISCVQNSECSTGCCQTQICQPTATCTDSFLTKFEPIPGDLVCRNTVFTLYFDLGRELILSTVNSNTIQLLRNGVPVKTTLDVIIGSLVTITPAVPLEDGTYTVLIKGGVTGVLSIYNMLTMHLPADFTTPAYNVSGAPPLSSHICNIDHVKIFSAATNNIIWDPTKKVFTGDLFTCSGDTCANDLQPATPGNQHGYYVQAYDANDDGPLTLSSQTWTQADTGGTPGPINVYSQGTAGASCPLDAISNNYCSQSYNFKNGTEQLSVTVVGTGTTGTASTSMPISTFMCTKPWPAAPNPFPFRDPVGSFPSHNFTFGFCADDLNGATLTLPPVLSSGAGEVRKEYFLFVTKNGVSNGDAIGVRVIGDASSSEGTYNFDYSPQRWYLRTFGKASTGTTFEVDGYTALREGRTVYVVADYLFPFDPGFYERLSQPAVYVFSHTDNAKPETLQIFEQIIKNLRFNDESTITDQTRTDLRNDLKRLQAMLDVVYGISAYYNANKKNPVLETGTYIKNMTMTAWPSWQQELGKTLGITMPKDPQGLWSPSLCSGFDPVTCWNQNLKLMKFPNDIVGTVYPPESTGIAYRSNASGSSADIFSTGSARTRDCGSGFGCHMTPNDYFPWDPADNICAPNSPASSCFGFNILMGSASFANIIKLSLKPPADGTAPTVIIEEPPTPPTPPPGPALAGVVTFVVKATDTSGINYVKFSIKKWGSVIASGTVSTPGKDGKYRWTWNSRLVLNSPPPYTLSVTATDRANNSSVVPVERIYTVTNPPGDTEPPEITATPAPVPPPAPPAQWTGVIDVGVSATATDVHPSSGPSTNNTGVAKIEFYLGASKIGEAANPACTPSCSNPFTANVNIPAATIKGFPNGSYTYSVVAYDGYGNTSVKTFEVIVAKTTETTPPDVAITLPLVGSSISGVYTDVLATATDTSGIDRVEFFVDFGLPHGDTAPRAVDFNGPYSFSWVLTGYVNGSPHNVRAVAYDRYGNSNTATWSGSYNTFAGPDTQRPSIDWDTPLDGASVKNTITIHARLTDDREMSKTELRIDGVVTPPTSYTCVLPCSSNQIYDFTYTWNTLFETVGPHTLTLSAYDLAGNTATVSRTVTVDNPVIMSITQPRTGMTVRDESVGLCGGGRKVPLVCQSSVDCPHYGYNGRLQGTDPCVLGSDSGIPITISVTKTCRADQLLDTVELRVDGQVMDKSLAPPLQVVLNNCNGTCNYIWKNTKDPLLGFPNGVHTITALGTDSTGCQGGGKSIIVLNNPIIPDIIPPTIGPVTYSGASSPNPWPGNPPPLTVTVTSTGTINVHAVDNPGGSGMSLISITVDGALATECAIGTPNDCSYFWSPSNGNHKVTAHAEDMAGNAADFSQDVTVNIVPMCRNLAQTCGGGANCCSGLYCCSGTCSSSTCPPPPNCGTVTCGGATPFCCNPATSECKANFASCSLSGTACGSTTCSGTTTKCCLANGGLPDSCILPTDSCPPPPSTCGSLPGCDPISASPKCCLAGTGGSDRCVSSGTVCNPTVCSLPGAYNLGGPLPCQFCGDGIINGGSGVEDCDPGDGSTTPENLGGKICATALTGVDKPGGAPLRCYAVGHTNSGGGSDQCKFDTSSCYFCGDGTINAGEQCEGSNLNGNNCQSATNFGRYTSYNYGTLSCNNTARDSNRCLFNTSACYGCHVDIDAFCYDNARCQSECYNISTQASCLAHETSLRLVATCRPVTDPCRASTNPPCGVGTCPVSGTKCCIFGTKICIWSNPAVR